MRMDFILTYESRRSAVCIETSYNYDQKGQLTKLIHKDSEGVLDSYAYKYDILGNKMSIDKQRRGLDAESGVHGYGYDPIGRLKVVEKDGQLQRAYNYDAFGNRSCKEEIDGANNYIVTNYTYNQLNQLISMVDNQENNQEYNYDKRGNLSEIYSNNQLVQQNYYSALNRLESTYNHKKQLGATYSYNGLGHRIGKMEGQAVNPVLASTNLSNLNLNPTNKIDDVIDLTRQYHNLLSRAEGSTTTNFAWDFNVVFANSDAGEHLSYFQDDLGSPIRLGDEYGRLKESYGFDEFGNMQSETNCLIQPFTFTGYQKDLITEIYFAQAREYNPTVGRFVSEDLVKGFTPYPFTLNPYTYCWNQPMDYVDLDGRLPFLAGAAVGALVGAVVATVASVATDLANGNPVTLESITYATVAGAVAGAVIGSGVGLVAGMATAAVGGTAAAGTAATITMSSAVGAGAVLGGVNRYRRGGSGGNVVNSMIGNSWNGFVTSSGALLLTGGGASGLSFYGGFTGSIITDTLDNAFMDGDISTGRMIFNGFAAASIEWFFSLGGLGPYAKEHWIDPGETFDHLFLDFLALMGIFCMDGLHFLMEAIDNWRATQCTQ